METTVVIPARLSSSRLPHKVLADIHGHPLIWHVWQRVKQAQMIDQVFITTDSDEVKQAAEAFGAQVLMTSPECQSGTERIASVLGLLDGDLTLNVQGDEPLVDPLMLDMLVERWQSFPCDLITPVFAIKTTEELQSPNVVKVARASDGRALYFSRSPIPFLRDLPFDSWLQHGTFWGHIGVYGYSREVLAHYYDLANSPLEKMEKLEQLRFLEAGYNIQTIETDYRPNSVDIAEDLERVRQLIAQEKK
jgi:3-deoxy-manno-octulosonate cytidylyltransferase (CMP-KDO synthetase)